MQDGWHAPTVLKVDKKHTGDVWPAPAPEVHGGSRNLHKACQHAASLVFCLRVQEGAATRQDLIGCCLLRQGQALGRMHQRMQLVGHAVLGQVHRCAGDSGALEGQAQQGGQVEPGLVALIVVAACTCQLKISLSFGCTAQHQVTTCCMHAPGAGGAFSLITAYPVLCCMCDSDAGQVRLDDRTELLHWSTGPTMPGATTRWPCLSYW